MSFESLTLYSGVLAFAGGLVSFISPCVLPLLPVYLSVVSGVPVEDLRRKRSRVLALGGAFVAGFTVLFVLLGTAAGGIGATLTAHRTALSIIGGVVLIVAGILMLDVVHLPSIGGGRLPRLGGPGGAFVAGAAVAIGWTPCVGPVLGAILTLAGSGQSPAAGAVLLFIYSLGLAVPFLAAALAYGWVSRRLTWVRRHYRVIRIVAGVVLIAAGLLMVTGAFDLISRALPSWSPIDV